MSHLLFILYSILMVFLAPLFRFLSFFSSKIQERIEFENKNIIDTSCQSFKKIHLKADYAYEVSSEGELEQCLPLIMENLKENKRIEIIYCSESVEGKCIQIYKKHPHQVRLLRLPLLTFNLWGKTNSLRRWLTAPVLILCRYDFFPELLIYGMKKDVRFYLIWGTLKNKENQLKNPVKRIKYKILYNLFDKIITSTLKDEEYMKIYLGISQDKLLTYDFRIFQVANRIMDKETKLKKNFPGFDLFSNLLNTVDRKKRIIIGNFWDTEHQVLNYYHIKTQLEQKCIFVIVPHKVDPVTCEKNISILKEKLMYQIPIYVIDSITSLEEIKEILDTYKKKPGIIYLNLKGVLVELYGYFQLAYVGGGFHYYVHSLLEPFVAGCNVICGPRTERSTEYDFIMENSPQSLQSFKSFDEIQDFLKKQNAVHNNNVKIDEYLQKFKTHYQWLLT